MALPRRCLPAFLALLLAAGAAPPATAADAADVKIEPPDAVAACGREPRAVRITVENVRNGDGIVTAELYLDDEDGFLKKRGRVARMRVPARPGPNQLCLVAPEPGSFTVAVFHDENADLEINQDFLGIPTEGYGFSNNPGFRFGLPSMEEIRIAVDQRPVDLTIRLTYL